METPAFADQKRFCRKLVQDALQCPRTRHGLEMNTPLTGSTNRHCAGGVTPDAAEQTDDVLRGNLQPLADFGEVGFREKIGEPG